MIEPENTGYIDFKRVGIMLSSLDGTSPPLLKKQKISAVEAVDCAIENAFCVDHDGPLHTLTMGQKPRQRVKGTRFSPSRARRGLNRQLFLESSLLHASLNYLAYQSLDHLLCSLRA